MTTPLPTEHKDRSVVVDVIRGFALIGVLIANFTSYVDQQTPEAVLNSISSPLDIALMSFNSVFIEWKFMTLFSILFGYGFGLILESLQRKNINPDSFFARRMFWLFIFIMGLGFMVELGSSPEQHGRHQHVQSRRVR